MPQQRALCRVISGPNAGDVIELTPGSCRLIGRSLSANETSLIDRDGNRQLDAGAAQVLQQQLQVHRRGGAPMQRVPSAVAAGSFERGQDVIFADDAISRAHAMLFCDPHGVGIIDLASTNGTFVNNRRTTSSLLQDGDVLAIGDSELSVHVRGS